MRNKKLTIIVISILVLVFGAFTALFMSLPSKEEIRKNISENIDNPEFLKNQKYVSRVSSSKRTILGNKMDVSYGNYLGVSPLLYFIAKEDTEITFDYNVEQESGRFKLYLLKDNSEVEEIADDSMSGTKSLSLKEGRHRLMLMGLDSKVKMNFNFYPHENVIIRTELTGGSHRNRINTD